MKRLLPLSALLALSPALSAGIIAYDVPFGVVGNQNFGGSLGMDFDVHDVNGIDVSDVGVFDSGSDGINGPLNVAIFDRTTQSIVPGTSAALNGTDGTAMGGQRFSSLGSAVHLPGGFQGSIVAWGYNAAELDLNGGGGQTTNGGTSLTFVGLSRWGNAGAYPTNVDAGPANRYGAGSFIFDEVSDIIGGSVTALATTTGTVGTQTFTGQLGMDFVVTTPIRIDALGVFDSGGDGLSTAMTAELWSRSGDTPGAMLASQTIAAGTGSTLDGGHRFDDLGTTLILAPGEYTIVGHGFSAADPNGNVGTGNSPTQWNDQNGAIVFDGSRFGVAGAGVFPETEDGDLPNYLGGSFQYTVPEPGLISLLAFAIAGLAIRRRRK